MIGLREDQQMKARMVDFLNHATGLCGSWLVGSPHRCDAGASVCQSHRGDAIAGKPGSHTGPIPHWTAVGFRPGVGSAASKGAG